MELKGRGSEQKEATRSWSDALAKFVPVAQNAGGRIQAASSAELLVRGSAGR
jgi:hypothetical protein